MKAKVLFLRDGRNERTYWKAHLWTLAQRLVSGDYRAIKNILQRENFVQPGRSYLDFGCGTGTLFPVFSGAEYLGIDIDEEAISYARHRHGKQYFLALDGRQLTELGRIFEGVFIMGVIHHLSDSDAAEALRGIRQVLHPKGQVLVIELIPALSRANLLGRFLRAIDQGQFIREASAYAHLFARHFHVEKAYIVSRYPLDYGVFVLRLPSNAQQLSRKG